jgi:hypothetical protein
MIEGDLEISVPDASRDLDARKGDIDWRTLPVTRAKLEHAKGAANKLYPPVSP